MANMNFKANILPATSQGYNLGSSTQQWVIHGPIYTNGIFGTEDVDYGDTLPATAVDGQIFFQTSDTVVYSVPAGGTAGYALVKNTNANGDFSWQEVAHESYFVLSAQQNGTSASLVTTGEKYTWDNSGTVKSVQVSGTSPIVSSDSTSATTVLSTTISLADEYGDIKNPYAAKSGGYVLAGPVSLIGTKTRTSNLLDVNDPTVINAYINSSGGISNNVNDRLGPFIAVTPGQDIYYTGTVGETSSASINRRLHVYTSDQTWIQQLAYQTLQIGDHWSVHGTVPSNGAYVRVSWGNTDTQVMISVGAPTQYEPYYNVINTQNYDVPTFRPLAANDIPTLNIVDQTTGTLAINRGGTGATSPAAAWANLGGGDIGKLNKGNASATATFLAQNGTWLTPPGTYVLPKATDSLLGGITVGDGLSVTNGNVSVDWSDAPVTSVNGATGTVVLNTLHIGNSVYNGSTTVTVSVTDLGLTAPMTFRGVTDTTILDGSNVSPVNITSGGTIGSLTPANGDVVLQKDEQIEYLYTGSAWTSLGIASSYSLAEHAHGYIVNDGTMPTTVTATTGDHLLITDASDYNRIVSAGNLTFDASSPQSALSRAGTWVDFLQLSGGTMTGALKTQGIIGSLDYDYGEVLPTTATEGQLFFQVSYGEDYYVPAGGTAGYALVKNSNNDGDFVWKPAIPQGGTAGYALVKNSNADGDYTWGPAVPSGGTTGQALVKNSNANGDTTWATISADDRVLKAGDTMTGNLTISRAGVAWTKWVNTQTQVSIEMWSDTTNQGIYTRGYWTGSAYTASAGWILYRGTDSYVHTSFRLYGAVWNDYAEFRQSDVLEPGRVIKENGDDTLSLSTKRLERGCEIVSDTFGFAVGETSKAKTPTAATGRVLAYPYEDREIFKQHIGWPVCSGPNGTVSIMTEEEERLYPSRIIGTISAVPDYEVWYGGNQGDTPIKINNRIWIRIR